MDGNLSDALNDGLWVWPLIALLFYCRLNLQGVCAGLVLSNVIWCDELVKKIFNRSP